MAQILIEESAIDTLRDTVQKLQDDNDEMIRFMRQIENTFHRAYPHSIEYACYLKAHSLIAKHTTEPKVMA